MDGDQSDDESNYLWWAALAGSAAAVIAVGSSLSKKRPPVRSTELRGHNIVVTGANSGIGLATTRELHKRGASLIAAVRDTVGAAQVFKDMKEDFKLVELDLNDLDSIAAAARTIKEGPPVTVLINNAGAMNPEYSLINSVEKTMMSNMLGPFSLTRKLTSHMKGLGDSKPRVVNVGSKLAKNSDIGTEVDIERDLRGLRSGEGKYSMWKAYANSKYVALLCTNHLAEKEDKNIVHTTVTPGVCNTRLNRWANPLLLTLSWPLRLMALNSPEKGASGVIFAAASDEAGTKPGAVYDSNAETPTGTFGEWRISKSMDSGLSSRVHDMVLALLDEVEKGERDA